MKQAPPEADRLGVEVTDLDLRTLDAAGAAEMRRRVYEHKLLVFRGQDLTTDEYLALARTLGRPQVYFQDHYHHPEHPEIFVNSNVPEHGQKVGVAGTGRFWHTDYSFFDEPLATTLVYPQTVPEGPRSTYYINMARVARALPAHLRTALEGRRCFHEATYYYKVQPWDIDKAIAELIEEFRAVSPGAWHPALLEHPVTGEESLYVSSGFTTKVEGVRHEEAKELLAELFAFVERDEHVQPVPWEQGLLLYWDNRALIHRSSNVLGSEPSVSYRIGVYDDLPFYVGHEV